MKHKQRYCFLFILIIMISSGIGYTITRSIPVEYLTESSENGWIQKLADRNFSGLCTSHPTVAVNLFRDERENTDCTGFIYSRSGKKLETLVTDKEPTEIIEKILIEQLQKAGYTVIRTTGWNMSAEKVPAYLEADLIVSGRVKAFWVQSNAGLITSTVRSKVVYDLVIADVHKKKLIYEGEAEGNDTRKSLVHISDYFWMDIQTSLSQSLTKAMNDFK